MALKQDNRLLSLKTPLGENQLLLISFSGEEQISGLFQFHLEMISDDHAIQAKDIVGKEFTIGIELADNSIRYFHGFVNRFSAGDEDEQGRRNYDATVVPWLWFLTQTADCRIFQEKKVPDIVEQIFQDLGFNDFDTSEIKNEHKEREYCVQYRETDFNFVSRLLEEEGIFYFFKFEDGKHTLVLADQNKACKDCPEKEVDFPRDMGTRAVEDYIVSWRHNYEYRPGKWAQTDYNFKTPSTNLMTNTDTLVDLPNISKYEVYDYPGLYENKGVGDTETKLRMEAEEIQHDIVEGTSFCKSFTAGGKFKLRQHRSATEEGKSYILTAVNHAAHEPFVYETSGDAGEAYRNSFTCTPDGVAYRPVRTTDKPIVQGVQTAVVVGPGGEEIYVDEFGRVKVQFHWDREGQRDENSSCWIRVSQVHAGPGFGGIDIPRIDEEVIISFLEGDPDRPIITGRVYHAENMPPFGLPDSKTISGLKSKTYKGDGYNEFVMDDTPGNELIREHAQYNKDTTVEHDQTLTVHNNRMSTIDVDDTESVGSNQSITVNADQSTTVGANQTTKVSANQTESIGGNRGISISGNDELGVSGSQKIGVSGPIEISSDTSITLKVGGSTVKIEPASVSIKSTKVTIEGQAKVETKGAAVISSATGINEVKGATVKLN